MRRPLTIAAGGVTSAAVVTLLTPLAAVTSRIVAEPPVHVSVADAGKSMGEVLIAADPADRRRLVACAMIYSNEENRMWVSAYRTDDRGRTWTRVLETRGADRANEADPSCTFGRDGRVYLAAISHRPYGNFTAETFLKLFRSVDGGARWSQSVMLPVKSFVFDREYLVVDRTGGQNDGTLYMNAAAGVRGSADAAAEDAVGLWLSRDAGTTFETPLIRPITAGQFVMPRANSVVLSDGTVAILFGELNKRSPSGQPIFSAREWNARGQAAARLRIATSADGGRSLQLGAKVADCYMSSSLGLGAQSPYLAVDPGSAAFKDRLYVVWPDARSGRSEILLAYSADKGQTWSTPIFVDDDHGTATSSTGGDDSLPVVAVNQHGVVGVMWYDRREVPDGLGWDVRFAASTDGGQTFAPSIRLSTATSRFGSELRLATFGFVDDRNDTRQGHDLQVNIQARQFFAGDTAGMAADAGGVFHPAWIDHRTGTSQVWSASVSVDAKGVRNGSPALERLNDVSSSITLDVQSTAYDQHSSEVGVTIALRNTSATSVPLPLTMRLLQATSEVGDRVDVLNADNQSSGPDAVWEFGSATAGGRLDPQATTAPRTLRFRLRGAVSYKAALGYRSGLVRMHARILAPSP